MIEVIKSGPQLSIQDLGRFNYRHLGVSQAGAADSDALRIANRLVGNPDNTPALEVTLGMAQLKFCSSQCFSLSGADMSANLNGARVDPGWSYQAQPGDILTFASSALNLRCYLAFAGGIAATAELGSYSTDIMAGLGANHGRALCAGERIAIHPSNFHPQGFGARLPTRQGPIHFIPEQRDHGLTASIKSAFIEGQWQVAPQSNRMGLRLHWPQHERLSHYLGIASTAVSPGTIQLPGNGEPIVLLNDCQTTGGYPILGHVISADLPRLGQARAGAELQFEAVSLAQAETINAAHQHELNRLEIAMRGRQHAH